VSKVNRIQYEIILYWSQVDQAFIVEVPEVAGCAPDGATTGRGGHFCFPESIARSGQDPIRA